MKKTERDMFPMIKKWQASGINPKEFCNTHDLSLQIFYYWVRKYKRSQALPGSGFIPVEVNPIEESFKGEVQILYPNGVQITLSDEVSIPRIKALINAI